MCLLFVLSTFSLAAIETFALDNNVGDVIELGSYPQSEVKDSSLISELSKQNLKWTSYEYYSGTGDVADGNMTAKDYMKYADIEYKGTKYRAVTFTEYRPYCTGLTTDEENSRQNGYLTGQVYWFKYEPLKWRVLDASTGLVLCESVIDSQAFSNYCKAKENDAYNSDDVNAKYASDWETSSLREWLNDDFYNTAFSKNDKKSIKQTTISTKNVYPILKETNSFGDDIDPEDLDESISSNEKYCSKDTTDNVFILSLEDMKEEYGFKPKDEGNIANIASCTDYAKCQGLEFANVKLESLNKEVSIWMLRTPMDSYQICAIGDSVGATGPVFLTNGGIRPAICIQEKQENIFTVIFEAIKNFFDSIVNFFKNLF